MYGRKKKFLVFFIIAFIIAIIAGGSYFILQSKQSSRLSIKYIGGDKYVDDVLSLDDFEVSDTKTNKVINKKNLQLAAKPLNIDGTAAVISYTVNGKTYSASKTVYPTLVIEKISAELVAENKHIGSKLKKEDFKVIGTNNKKEDVELKEFTLSHTVLKDAENDVKIEYVSSAGTVSTTLHISVTENFVVGVEAKYTGQSVFVGEDVDEDKFEVYAVWDDDAKTKVEDYRVSQASVSEDSSVVSVSITDEQGKTFYTDVRIKSINYVVDIDSVAYIGQEQTIGNTVKESDFDVYGIYYDGTKKKVDSFKISSGKVLKDLENTVEISVTNELGDELKYRATVNAEQNIIYVGDSRIRELQAYEGSEDAMKSRKQDNEKVYYVYDDNATLEWFNSTGVQQVQDILDKNPYTTFRIVLNIGLFDFDNVDAYADTYSKLAKTTWKNHRLYIDSLNPVDEAQMDGSGVYSRANINTTKINTFNKEIEKKVSGYHIDNLNYINTYGALTNVGFTTTNGVNYDNTTYGKYHDSVKTLSQ